MTAAVAPRAQRCPNCGRLLGKSTTSTEHANCPAQHETKCGKCNSIVLLSMNPNRPPVVV